MMKIACDEVVTETTPLPYMGSPEALPYEGQIIPVYQSIKYERREVSAELYLVIPALTAMGQIWRSPVGDRVPLQHRGSRDRATIKSLSVGQGSARWCDPAIFGWFCAVAIVIYAIAIVVSDVWYHNVVWYHDSQIYGITIVAFHQT